MSSQTTSRESRSGGEKLPSIRIRDQRVPGWWWAQNELIDRHAARIGVYAVAVYAVLARKARNDAAQVSMSEIALLLGISRRQVVRAIERLVTEKLAWREGDKQTGEKNSYVLRDLKAGVTDSHTPQLNEREGCDPQAQEVRRTVTDPVTMSHTPVTNGHTYIRKQDFNKTENKNGGSAAQAPPSPQGVTGTATAKPKTQSAPELDNTDARYEQIVDALRKCWLDGVPFAFTEADGVAIKKLLAKLPRWSGKQIALCVAYRRMSEGQNPTAEIRRYIGTIHTFASGPRNKWGDQLAGTCDGRPLHEYRKAAEKLLGLVPEQVPPEAHQAPDPQHAKERFKELHGVRGKEGLGMDAVRSLLEFLKKKVNRHSFDTWLKPCKFLCLDAERVCWVLVPTPEFKHVGEKYGTVFREWCDLQDSSRREIADFKFISF